MLYRDGSGAETAHAFFEGTDVNHLQVVEGVLKLQVPNRKKYCQIS